MGGGGRDVEMAAKMVEEAETTLLVDRMRVRMRMMEAASVGEGTTETARAGPAAKVCSGTGSRR